MADDLAPISINFDWRFSWRERLKILLGRPISVIVEQAPEHDPGLCRTTRQQVVVWRFRPLRDPGAMSDAAP